MEKFTIEWFNEGLVRMKKDEFSAKHFNEMNSVFQFKIGDPIYTFYAYDHGIQSVTPKKVYHGVDFCLEGSIESWDKLVKGEIGITQGLSPLYKKLSLQGSPVSFQANLVFVYHFIKILKRHMLEGAPAL